MNRLKVDVERRLAAAYQAADNPGQADPLLLQVAEGTMAKPDISSFRVFSESIYGRLAWSGFW